MNPIIDQAVQERHVNSFKTLITFLMENAGVKEEDLNAILTDFFSSRLATEQDIVLENPNKIISTSNYQTAWNKELARWLQGTPEAIDTLQELSEILKNDPEIIDKLLTLIGEKASKKDLEKIRLSSNVDFNHPDWDLFFGFSVVGMTGKPSGMYHGVASTERLKLKDFYPDVKDARNCNVTVSISTVQFLQKTILNTDIETNKINLSVEHQGVVPIVYVNDVRTNLSASIDLQTESKVVLVDTGIVEGDVVKLEFLTNKALNISKACSILITASTNGSVFNRTLETLNGAIIPNDMVPANVWVNATADTMALSNAIIAGCEEAIAEMSAPVNPE